MIDRIKTFVANSNFLRRSVTVPLKAIVVAGVGVAIVMVATIASARLHRAVGSSEAVATAADVAALRQSIEGLRSVCAPRPAAKK